MQLTAAPSFDVTQGEAGLDAACTGAADGNAFSCSFGTLSPGATVRVTVPVKVITVTGSSPHSLVNTATVTTSSFDAVTSNNSDTATVEVESYRLYGNVYRDFNDNGDYDRATETGIPSVALTLTGTYADGTPIATTIRVNSNSSGYYEFPRLPRGTYTITRGAPPNSDNYLKDGAATAGSHFAGATEGSDGLSVSNIELTATAPSSEIDGEINFGLVPRPMLGLAKHVSVGPTLNADGSFDVSFTVLAENLGYEPLEGITITDRLDDGGRSFGSLVADDASAVPGSYRMLGAPTGSCGGVQSGFNGTTGAETLVSGGTLAVDGTCEITVQIRVWPSNPEPTEDYLNQASGQGTGEHSEITTDPDLSDNGSNPDPNGNGNPGDPGENDPTPVAIPPMEPAITVTKTATPGWDTDATPAVGDVISYSFTITNSGNVNLTEVMLTDEMMAGANGDFELTGDPIPLLVPGAVNTDAYSATYVLTQEDLDRGNIDNIATVTGTPPRGDDVTGEDEASVPMLARPSIQLTKAADAEALGDPPAVDDIITYSFLIENTGNVPLTGITLDDPLVEGLDRTPATIPDLAPGEEVTVTVEYPITQDDIEAGEVLNTATATGTPQPDTLPQRDILRGTGGSVYFLKRQDINGGSETVTVQVVDPDTGRVVRTRRLSAGVDYEIDYFQGVVTLAEPLNSSASGSGIIGSGPLGSYDVNLVVQYEYTPTISDVDGNSLGGRAEFNVAEGLRLGVSAMKENTANAERGADQRMAAVDLRYEFGEQSHILVEAAQSEGPGFGRSISTDGGLTITPDGGVSGPDRRARAYSADAHLSFGDLGLATPGYLTVYGESKQAGFSTLTEDVDKDQWLWGIETEAELSAVSRVGLLYERFHRDGGDRKDSGELRYSRDLNANWTLDLAVAHLDRVLLSRPEDTGRRTDLGARLTWERDEDLKIYGFGQGTVSRSGQVSRNNRLGLGFETRLTEKLRFAAEYSDGSLGEGGAARVTYAPTADSEVYLGYTLDPTRSEDMRELIGRDDGVIVAGTRYRYSDRFSTFAENRWDLYGTRRSLAESYGVTYTPGERWTITGGMEIGTVRDSIGGDFERRAVSLGLGYSDNDLVRGRARLEYRTEEGEGLTRDRDTWALALGYEYKVNDDWRLLFNLDSLFSDSAEDSYRDGEYLEFGMGYAYRPVLNDRLNMLLKYTYLHDLPGEDQVTASGSEDGPMQKSHVFSVDANYDLTPKLTIGGKYGYRRSKVADRGTEDFVTSSADLAILRLDWHVVHMWDILAEGRILRTRELKIDETGALLGVYRHLGNHAKIGVGYEWGKVSDDLTDLDYLGDGLFLNLVAKF